MEQKPSMSKDHDQKASTSEDHVQKDIRKIEVTFKSITGLRPIYPFPLITLYVEFENEPVLEIRDIAHDDNIELNHTIILECNCNDHADVERYLSSLLVIRVIENEGKCDPSIIISEQCRPVPEVKDQEELLQLKEALTGVKELNIRKRKDTDDDKRSRKKSSVISFKGRSSKETLLDDVLEASERQPMGPQDAGSCALDLLHLFLGEQVITQSLILNGAAAVPLDDRVPSVARLPKIDIEVRISEPLPRNIIHCMTVESIFNLPSVMLPTLNYKLAIHCPIFPEKVLLFNSDDNINDTGNVLNYKKFYRSNALSMYHFDSTYSNVKISCSDNMWDIINKSYSVLQYNTMKRSIASEAQIEAFKIHLSTYKNLIAEIYVQERPSVPFSTQSPKTPPKRHSKDKGSKASKDRQGSTSGTPEPDYIHLMAYLDFCQLLYPGQRTIRIGAQLRTFNLEEAQLFGGIEDSYFRPKPKPPTPTEVDVEKKTGEKKGSKRGSVKGEKKGSKKGSSKSDKSSKGKGSKKSLSSKLPPGPVVPELSKLIFNEAELPCILVLQFDLREPLTKERNLEDLSNQLHMLINIPQEITALPKTGKTWDLAEDIYKETIMSLTRDLKYQYTDYMKGIEESGDKSKTITEIDFLKYLQKQGVYQTYIATLTRACTMYVSTVHNYKPENQPADKYRFISRVYVELVEKMHATLNELFYTNSECQKPLPTQNDRLRMYAYEALELNAHTLAHRYFLERICNNEFNADYWLDYAIYFKHICEPEIAMECIREVLLRDKTHRNALVLFALLLNKNGQYTEAETCLLNVTLHEPMWVEGWGALYCIYMKHNNVEGMNVALEMAQQNFKLSEPEMMHDLIWTKSVVPQTLFYRMTCYFISLRCYYEAEMMLSNEILLAHKGVNEYLLAVISFYRKDYEHALLHIDNAYFVGRCDYAICSLRGHILAAQGELQCAIESYQKIYKLFEQPAEEYMYMVYIQAGLCHSQLHKDQEARMTFLKACQLKGSPFTWLCAGIIYYNQRDFLSADECLTQANSMDNRLPEVWIYLCLVNIKLKRLQQAQICIHQAQLNNLDNEKLLEKATEDLEKLTKECNA